MKLKVNSLYYNENKPSFNNQETVDTVTGARSKASIIRIVMKNLNTLTKVYNRQLWSDPDLAGRINTKFVINDTGKVIHAEIEESTTDNIKFERKIVEQIKKWEFDKIDKPGDLTVVRYPFYFSK